LLQHFFARDIPRSLQLREKHVHSIEKEEVVVLYGDRMKPCIIEAFVTKMFINSQAPTRMSLVLSSGQGHTARESRHMQRKWSATMTDLPQAIPKVLPNRPIAV
jgi:hypothetical protein